MSKKYIIQTMVKAYTNLVSLLEKKWADKHAPSFRAYTLFKKGIHSTMIDVRYLGQLCTYIALSSQSVVELLPTLSRHQVYVLRQVPKDLVRISPVLILSTLPGCLLILPIFFAFPRVFLSRAFWTPEQCKFIDTENLAYRFDSKVLSLLLEKLQAITQSSLSAANYSQPVLGSLGDFAEVLNQVSKSKPMTVDQVPSVVAAFSGPLSLERLDSSHLVGLCRLHGLSICSYAWTMNSLLWCDSYMRKSVVQTSHRCMDTEKAFFDNPSSEIKQLCLLRGINPYSLDGKDLVKKLRSWISISIRASRTDFCFRLHLPLLLCYNDSRPIN
ncbi:unnamed protein product [Heterobilharzia americana]|nr:unnamed protein product [Heterobilharzia americana]